MASAATAGPAPRSSPTLSKTDIIENNLTVSNNGGQNDVVVVDHNRESTSASQTTEDPRSKKTSLIGRITTWSPVLVLENSGSVARDHLASERTWLAYIRTSLAISSSGVALVQLFTIAANRSSNSEGDPFSAHIQRFARPLGATTVLIGLGVCLLGLYRYFTVQSTLTTGKFPTARLEVHTVSLLLGALTGIVFGVLVAFPR